MRKLLPVIFLILLGSCASLGAGAAAGIAVRAGAGAVSGGALISRVMVTESAATAGMRGLYGATSQSILQRSLVQLTANGTRSSALSITRNGVIRSGSYEVASIAPGTGEVFVGRRAIGSLADSVIVENGVAVARLRGFVPASSLRVGTVTQRAGYRVLDRPLVVTVEAVQGNGLYLIRVGQAEALTVDASVLMLALLPVSASDGCNEAGGMAVLNSGETYNFDRCYSDGDVTSLVLNDQETLIYTDEIDGFVDLQTADGLSANRIAFSTGDGTYGRMVRHQDLVEIFNDDNEIVMLADTKRL